jgi:hypothetical protein
MSYSFLWIDLLSPWLTLSILSFDIVNEIVFFVHLNTLLLMFTNATDSYADFASCNFTEFINFSLSSKSFVLLSLRFSI